jgi:heptosyltransferase-2
VRRVLFIRFSAIGDVLLTTPVIRLFHRCFPGTEIDFLIKEPFFPLVRHHPLLQQIRVLPQSPTLQDLSAMAKQIRTARYDWIVDLQGHWQSLFLTWNAGGARVTRYRKYSIRRFFLVYLKRDFYRGVAPTVPERYARALRPLGCEWAPLPLELFIPDEVEEAVSSRWPFAEEETVVALAPGAGRATKRWPAERYAELARHLQEIAHARILLLGGAQDRQIGEAIRKNAGRGCENWCGETSLLETAAALRRVRCLVTNDTGVMHMARAVSTPLVAIFGPTVRQFGFYPEPGSARIVEVQKLRCRPCSYHGTATCPKKHFRCMLDIGVEEVLHAVLQQLGSPDR